jgi:Fic family protein
VLSDLNWPALRYETLQWSSQATAGTASRAQVERHRGPYRAAVVPPIAEQKLYILPDVAAGLDDAANELSRFDAELGGEIAPFSAVLLRSESAASSQIENLTASARAIAEAEIGTANRRNAAQIVANTRAMRAAIALSDRIDAQSILSMHEALMKSDDPEGAGRWREQQVWIGGGSLGPHEADFVAPHHSRVVPGIDDLIKFIDRHDMPVLAHAALAHAQFETIHPFTDGNGRTGRALVHAMMRGKALTRSVTVPISAGLLTDTRSYFEALTRYREGDPSAIIRQFAQAVFISIANGRTLVGELRQVRAGWRERIRLRRDSAAWQIADLLLRHPVINSRLIIEETAIAANNVYRYLEPLVEAKVITEFTYQKRNRAWRSDEVLAALDAFAARAGRRG